MCHVGGIGEGSGGDEFGAGGREGSGARCEDGLICKIDPPPGAVIQGHHAGICKAIAAGK